MQAITRYRAFDGKEFDTTEECKAYEGQNVVGRLIGLTAEQIQAAIDRTDIELADAIEAVAARITKLRYAQGEKRRIVKGIKAPVVPDAGTLETDLDPAYRGDRDFKAGKPGIVPDDLKDDQAKVDAYLGAWDAASLAAGQSKQVAA